MDDTLLRVVEQSFSTSTSKFRRINFQDGNGRMHRCLIHHVLAERKFTPPGIVFPVSSVMLDRIDDYRSTLRRALRLLNWVCASPSCAGKISPPPGTPPRPQSTTPAQTPRPWGSPAHAAGRRSSHRRL